MPDRYDSAVFPTELRLRDEILSKVRNEKWEPVDAFGIPNKSEQPPGGKQDEDSSSVTSTSETSTASFAKEEIDISDLSGVVIDVDGSKGFV